MQAVNSVITKDFRNIFEQYSWDEVAERIYSMDAGDVKRALEKEGNGTPEDFMALISPAAESMLEQMAQLSHRLTLKRFGKVLQMYIPMYLSNECQNICTYCGFSFDNKIARVTLNEEQILREVEVIKKFGYDHILLVSGEANQTVGTEYFEKMIRLIRPYFSNIMLEVQPLEQDEYELLINAGVNTVLVYQETYHEENYKLYHPKGKKSNFNYRLQTPDRLGNAGVHRMGLGALLGLEDWRVDSFFTALHLDYLEKNYWKTKYSISFPRLRPAVGCQQPNHPMSDKQLVQLICAYRIFNENVELSLSTRESPVFRNHAIKLGITSISAGSKTDPGGYAGELHALEQFEISDERSPESVAAMIASQGYEPVWKDWDRSF
ncbi:MAG: 2-iminoacetate synthase ThiH [Chitinophagaceae bacterium]|nr:2-iminoacetate synthase ThiH [Chitinophagaceae bacterium]